jgi:hypothetical protein
MKREIRRLREEEIKKILERKKKQAFNRKLEILEKDIKVNDNLENLKRTNAVFSSMK